MAVFKYFKKENDMPAAAAARPVNRIAAGGDKSVTHRALIFAALARGASIIRNPSLSLDCSATMAALASLGAGHKYDARSKTITIKGCGGDFAEPGGPIDCANSGTTARLLMGALAGASGACFTLTGDASLVERPMLRAAAPLEKMGARIVLRSGGRLPAAITGAKLSGAEFDNTYNSAQVKASLIFAALGAAGRTEIFEKYPTRDHSELMAPQFGVKLKKTILNDGGSRITIPGRQKVCAADIKIPNDPSTAAFYITLDALFQAVHSKRLNVKLPSVLINDTRNGFFECLFDSGFDMIYTNFDGRGFVETAADIEVHYGGYSPIAPQTIESPARVISMIDEIPLLALVLSLAGGESVISGLAELRVKETDRLTAIAAELNKMGACAAIKNDALVIRGVKKLKGAALESHNDHRMAMTLIIAGLVAGDDFSVNNCECAAVSNANFFRELKKLGFKFHIE